VLNAAQVYVALLRAFQPEARSLVRQALDILTPALEKRVFKPFLIIDVAERK